MSKLAQQILAGVSIVLIAGFALWLSTVNATLSAIAVELTSIHRIVVEVKTEYRREIDGVTKRVETLEARR